MTGREKDRLAQGEGWFEIVETARGLELRVLLREFQGVKIEKKSTKPKRVMKKKAPRRK